MIPCVLLCADLCGRPAGFRVELSTGKGEPPFLSLSLCIVCADNTVEGAGTHQVRVELLPQMYAALKAAQELD